MQREPRKLALDLDHRDKTKTKKKINSYRAHFLPKTARRALQDEYKNIELFIKTKSQWALTRDQNCASKRCKNKKIKYMNWGLG